MNLAEIMLNDISDSDNGICISIWFNGCDLRCPGCHNERLWNLKHYVPDSKVISQVEDDYFNSLKDGIKKSLSVLGGEPLSPENRLSAAFIIESLKKKIPDLYIRVWTGRTVERLKTEMDMSLRTILRNIDQIIVGPFIQEKKESLPLRGSSNQEILDKSQIQKEFQL